MTGMDLPTKKQAIEQIIVASFRAGVESARLYREPVEPIIEWDDVTPRITGYKVQARRATGRRP